MLLEQFPQRGEGWVRIRRPLAEDEPSGGFQDAVDLLEHAVVAERRDPEVADRGVEELAMVDDVPRVEHLEPDVPDARVPGPVRGDGDRAVRQVDRDDALRQDTMCDEARQEPGTGADVEEQFARFRVREPADFLSDRLEPRGHVLVVRLRHPAVLVDPHEGRLVRVHRRGAKKPRAIKASSRKGLCRSRRLRLRGRAGPPFQGGTGLHHPGIRRPLLSGKRSEGRRARPQRRRRLGPRREIVCGCARAATRPGGRDAGREGREGPQGCEEVREGARHRPSDHRHCADRELPGKPAPLVPGRPGRPGNLRARARMIVLYFIANTEGRIVMGTGNKSELLTGYFTLFGDGAADFLPIGDLYKTQVREMARYLALPPEIVEKVPTAGLWPGQTDEGELGISYDELDRILLGIELQLEPEAIAQKAGVPLDHIAYVQKLVTSTVHKRKMPLIPKVGARTIGLDWRE